MATIEMTLPDGFIENLELFAKQAEKAAYLAQIAVEQSQQTLSDSSEAYGDLANSIADIREYVHNLGNQMSGMVQINVLETLVRQIVSEVLAERQQ